MPDIDPDREAHGALTSGLYKAVVEHAGKAKAPPANVCASLLSVVAAIAAALRTSPEVDADGRAALDELTRRWETGFAQLMDMVRRDKGGEAPR